MKNKIEGKRRAFLFVLHNFIAFPFRNSNKLAGGKDNRKIAKILLKTEQQRNYNSFTFTFVRIIPYIKTMGVCC